MSVFIQRFMKYSMANKDTIAKAEQRWVERAKDSHGYRGTTPSKVYQAFAKRSGLTLEQMEDEINWLCWPTDSDE